MKTMILRLLKTFIRQAARDRLVRRVSSLLACLVVFVTAYALILPAITLAGRYPVLSAEVCSAWAGETMTVQVRAEAPDRAGEAVVTLQMEGSEAGLSEQYQFDGNGMAVITDKAGREILLHRTAQENSSDIIDYWFVLAPGQSTEFTLELQDEIPVKELIAAAGKISEIRIPDCTAEYATASDAAAAETASASNAAGHAAGAGAAATAAASRQTASAASASDAEKAAGIATGADAVRRTAEPADEDGHLADGEILNDLEAEDAAEAAEITAKLLVRAGSGESLEEAVRDAEKNAEKRGDAAKEFLWKAAGSTDRELSWSGNGVNVVLHYNSAAEIPEGASLSVKELPEGSAEYEEYYRSAENAVNEANAENAANAGQQSLSAARFFDITIRDEAGAELQPASQVVVKISYDNAPQIAPRDDVKVLHFAEIPEIVEAVVEGGSTTLDGVAFNASGFSIYAVVTVEDPYPDDFEDPDQMSLLISNKRNSTEYYLLGTLKSTGWMDQTADRSEAPLWVFTKITEGSYAGKYAVTLKGSEPAQYLTLTASGLSLGTTPSYFALTKNTNGTWLFQMPDNSNNYINHNDEKGFGRWSGGYGDAGNRIILRQTAEGLPEDVLGLDGKTFGIVNYKTGVTGVAIDAVQKNSQCLAGKEMVVRTDYINKGGHLLVAEDSGMPMWTFESAAGTAYQYYISTTVDGEKKYLTITGSAVSLSDTPTENSLLTVRGGTGDYEGKVRVTNSAGMAVNLYGGSASRGFGPYNDGGANEWMYLAEPSNLTEEDFVVCTANKVSVSDTVNVPNGAKVIVYTRIWNDTAKEYEFYVVNHNGDMVRAFESGETIQWVGLSVNTMLWDFTEYYYEGTETPNHYYELQNTYSGKYMAPQIKDGQILSDSPIGINLNGRRYGDYYSTILAWDDPYYDYAGYKVSEDFQLESVRMSKADDFYFAIMTPVIPGKLTTVETVDNQDYGITMSMQNHEGAYDQWRKAEASVFIGNTENTKGLVTTDLDEEGYPHLVSDDSKSLKTLFGNGEQVNHLFLQNTHDESGYFEYNCTETFAHLENSGNFTVYNQLGTVESGNKSLDHGQFLPYNDLDASLISALHSNTTNELDQELPDTNPRKGEALYAIPHAETDYYFGMQMEASFVQSPSGLDEWGHDIIFDFAGDDDMWLYVDGELILDLGGVHKAEVGTINFRTGAVKINNRNTTLREVIKANYITRGMTDSEAEEKVTEIFGGTGTVFPDYTSHTMKMFYMERGAGASNLHMRFNLTTSEPGEVKLRKKLSGTDKDDYTSVKFAYQIEYSIDEGVHWIPLEEMLGDQYSVIYDNTKQPVEFAGTAVIGESTYQNVFFLKPEEVADIRLGSDDYMYRITECGVDHAMYDQVSANGTVLEGAPEAERYQSFETSAAVISERKQMVFENHVDENALRTLTIRKRLYDAEGNELQSTDPSDPDTYDPTGFRFRLSLGETLDAYNQDSYYVRDPDGYYCRHEDGSFISLGKKEFSQLTEADLEVATFTTSPGGAADKIPAGYKVEIRNLLVGTRFKVEEREGEIPEGYTLKEYDRVGGSFIGEEPNEGIIRDNADPAVDVVNRRGWGLTVKKFWTDADFMDSHGPIYFGIYYTGETGDAETLVGGTLRQMTTDQTSLYWFLEELPQGGRFDQYVIREVRIVSGTPEADEDGYITNASSLETEPIAEGGILTVAGTPASSHQEESLSYTVGYETGAQTGVNSNLRTDMVTNSRPGVKLIKKDKKTEEALSGAVFTLTDAAGASVGAEIYTTDSEGLITILYPVVGTVYTLTETKSPELHTAISKKWNIQVIQTGEDGAFAVHVTNPEGTSEDWGESWSIDTQVSDETAVITIWNRPCSLSAKKTDISGTPLSGAHFALHRQVEAYDGSLRPDYNAIEGYEDLVTGADGIIPKITEALPKGTYYLREKQAPFGYNLLSDVWFTISETGEITCMNDWIVREAGEDGKITYTISVPNTKGFEFAATKVWQKLDQSRTEWLQSGNGTDVPLTMVLKRRSAGGTEDLAFEERLTVTSGSIILDSASDTLTALITGTYLTGWKISISGLEEKDSNEESWVYYLKESIPGGSQYTAAYTNTDTSVTDELQNGGTVTNTITNRHLKLLKVDIADPDRTALAGAQFNLYMDEALTIPAADAYGKQIGTITTDKNGLADLGELAAGTYYLSEITAPAGYVIPAKAVVIQLRADSISYDDGSSVSTSGTGIIKEEGTGAVILKITNSKGAVFPSTGGGGTLLYSMAGLMLMLAAALLFLGRTILCHLDS